MPRLIRSAVLSNYIEVARAAGLDPYRMIAEFHLPSASLTDPEVKVSAAAVGRLLEESAARSGKLDFGLRLADQRTFTNLGALALLVRGGAPFHMFSIACAAVVPRWAQP